MASNLTKKVIQRLGNAVLLQDGAGLTDGDLLGRFVEQKDDTAFAALVKRHGAMVWGVCFRILGNHHDAEDAFQAAFLVLFRKAGSVHPRDMVVNWLHGVARQAALHARRTAGRRREKQMMDLPEPQANQKHDGCGLQALLDEELSKLPDKYRAVILLCDIEGKTRKDVAKQLKVPEGTVAGRIARARSMLARRLARRGVTMAGGALAAAFAQNALLASVPKSAVTSTIKAASLLTAGQTADVISTKIAVIMEGVVKTMVMSKLKITAGLLLVLSFVSVGGGLLLFSSRAAERIEALERGQINEQAKPGQQKSAEQDKIAIQGTWKIFSLHRVGPDSELIEERKAKGERIIITADTIQIGSTEKGNFEIDPSKNPKTIDFINRKNGKNVVDAPGIYSLDGDELKICAATGIDARRPTQFALGDQKGVTLMVLKRERPNRQDDKADTQAIPVPAPPTEETAVGQERADIIEQRVLVKKAALTIATQQVFFAKRRLEAAQAALQRAKTTLALSETETERIRQAFAEGGASLQSLKQAEVKLTALQAAVAEAEAKVTIAALEVGIEEARVELARAELAVEQARLQQQRVGQPQPKTEAVVELLKTQLKAAQQTQRDIDDDFRRVIDPKNTTNEKLGEIYTWSVRWLEAQSELSKTKEERIAAFMDHHKRMTDLKKFTDRLVEFGFNQIRSPRTLQSAATWYVAEAERWLLRERAK